jgi:hypothetical protein
MNTRVRDLFVVPDHIKKGDFVVKLGEGIERPKETAETYVPTPALVDAFDRALKLIGSALSDARSQASYLHGSFGSGKSHFMALLSLMLSNHEEAWRLPELHGLREKHPFLTQKKLLLLHFHMIGQESIESAVFARYIEHVRAEHPTADLPGLFADEKLFDDARRMLDELGDAAFFAPMNTSPRGGWGRLGAANTWTRERFERAASSEKAEERAELFTALARTRFSASASAQGAKAFVPLDAGLATMARHAAGLGYGGIVLFLDELILWLASRASDAGWLHTEVQKMVKLVEAQEMRRAIPIVSFIARQRDLASMVGDSYAGAENVRLRDSLKYWADRYGTIDLEDRNLPAIVEKRVLRPKDAAAKTALDEAFERMKRAAGGSWQTMLGQQDGAAFRKLYPFSPALVEALVALSNSLQRERTAIKLLTEIMVEHVHDLEVGEVLRVGDLFDLLAGGDDTADGVMRSRFEAAKHLYKYQLLPLIQETHGTNTEVRCQRLRAGHPTRIGCSNCAEKACRSDNRIVKTLLISSLVPEVPALKDMNASRLVQLNHGTLKAPIAGTEASLVGQKLRKWASAIGQLHVGDQGDPTVRLVLEGVDLGPIMKLAAEHDTAGARQRVTRDLLFDAMGVDKVADWGKDHVFKGWRGTDRLGHIRFGNVRKLPPDALRCPEDHDWRIVVDYPFDDPGFGPNDDVEAIDKITQEGIGTWTLVWIPSFFSEHINKLLGELVILEHILENAETKRRYTSHLSVEHQSRALLDLDNLRNQKRARILGVIEQVYGLAKPSEADIDPARALDKHLHVLKPGASILPMLAANLASALDGYIPALLEARYPRHPKFTEKLTPKRVEKLLSLFGEIVDSDDKRVGRDRETLLEARGTLGELGLVRVTETAVHLLEDHTLQELEKRRAQKALDKPTAGEVRTWLDEGKRMGLEPDAADLVVRAYARWATRTLVRFDRPYEAKAGAPIPDEVVLEKPELPTQAEWAQALALAGSTLGLSLAGKALHADNLKRFEVDLAEKVNAVAADAAKLPGLVRRWQTELSVPDEGMDRLTTATLADAFCASIQGKKGLEQVRALAGFERKERAKAIGASLASAAANVRGLDDPLVLGVMLQLKAQNKGADLLETLAKLLRQDEVIVALAPRLKQLAIDGQKRLVEPPPPPIIDPTPTPTHDRVALRASGRDVLDALRKALATAEARVAQGDTDLSLDGTLTVRKPKP